jgi:hypothetical protein
MTRNAKIAAGVASVAILAGGTTSAYLVSSDSTSEITTSSPLAAPLPNVVAVGEDFIQLDWGPSQPGPFTPSNATVRSLRISWPPAIDTLHPNGLTYNVKKGSTVILKGVPQRYAVVGFTRSVRSFRFCVQAVSSTGKASPYKCTTFTGA